jgi:hypothetical protein
VRRVRKLALCIAILRYLQNRRQRTVVVLVIKLCGIKGLVGVTSRQTMIVNSFRHMIAVAL